MAIPTSDVSWSGIQTEFGGANPIGMSEYRRSNGRVPNLTTNASVPTTYADMSASKYVGSTKQNYYNSQTMFNTGSSLSAGSSYFTGLSSGWNTLLSTSYTDFTTPAVTLPLKLYVGGGGVSIGGGYRWYEDCFLFSCDTYYYYDRMKNPGVRVYDTTNNSIVLDINAVDTSEVNYNTNSGYVVYRYWNSDSVVVEPNRTYRLYYRCDFLPETGDNSFSWYGLNRPYLYAFNY